MFARVGVALALIMGATPVSASAPPDFSFLAPGAKFVMDRSPDACAGYADDLATIIEGRLFNKSKVQLYKEMSPGRDSYAKQRLYDFINAAHSNPKYASLEPADVQDRAFESCMRGGRW